MTSRHDSEPRSPKPSAVTPALRRRYAPGPRRAYIDRAMRRIGVHVLGHPRVTIDGEEVAVAGRPLVLVIRLAVAGAVPLSTGRLRDDLWPDGTGSDGAVRIALTRARKVLGADAILRRDIGYHLAEHDLDMRAFEQAVAMGRDPSLPHDRRAAVLSSALAIWSGIPFDGLDRHPWARAASVRLGELHEQALDEHFELLLAGNDHRHAMAGFRAELERVPTRERRAALLALALYRDDRQADALRVLADTRRHLRDELGLDPGNELRDLELRMLRHDPTLRGPDGRSVATSSSGTSSEVDAQLRAALTLIRAGAFPEAAEILDATQRRADHADDADVVGRVHLVRAQLAMMSGGDPHPHIDEARRIGRELRDGRLLARSALVRFGAGVPDDKSAALVELTEPIELLSPGDPAQVDLLCAAAVIITFIDASQAAEQLVEQAELAHERIGSTRSAAVVLVARSLVSAVRGDPIETTEAQAVEAYGLARQLEDPQLIVVAIQALLRARYTRGDLVGVDDVLEPLDRAARAAIYPFGGVRVLLCRTINALARGELDRVPTLLGEVAREATRLRTFSSAGAIRTQQLLLALETDRSDEIIDVARPQVEARGPSAWHAVLAMAGDEETAATLIDVADDVPLDDSHSVFVTLAAEVAARRGDTRLGAWCECWLSSHQELTVMVGLGTAVMGFRAHGAGLASVARGRFDDACDRFEQAVELASSAGAWLWRVHSQLELAAALVARGGPDDLPRARALLDELSTSSVCAASPRATRRLGEVLELADRCG